MTDKQAKVREQGKKRAQRLRDKRKAMGMTDFPVSLAQVEMDMLNQVCAFFGQPNEPYSHDNAITEMIHHFHALIPVTRNVLGCCGNCGEQLPEGCSKLKKGGLFKGDALCWHTLNRISIREIQPLLKGEQ